MHSDWFNGIEILQGRWQHGEKVGYCYPSRLEKTLCKWDIYIPLVMKGLTCVAVRVVATLNLAVNLIVTVDVLYYVHSRKQILQLHSCFLCLCRYV